MSFEKSILIASDHAGFELKEFLKDSIEGFTFHDLGPFSEERTDYPDFAKKLCENLSNNQCGILICGSGVGMSIMANRFTHIRAALCFSPELASLSRLHNDANVLCIGARFTDKATAKEMVETFLTTQFEGGRHEQRVKKLFYRS